MTWTKFKLNPTISRWIKTVQKLSMERFFNPAKSESSGITKLQILKFWLKKDSHRSFQLFLWLHKENESWMLKEEKM